MAMGKLIVAALLASGMGYSYAQGFGQAAKDGEARMAEQLARVVGQTFWVYPNRHRCMYDMPDLFDKPDIIGTTRYVSKLPIKVEATGIQSSVAGTRYFAVRIDGKVAGFTPIHQARRFTDWLEDKLALDACVSSLPPDQMAAREKAAQDAREAEVAAKAAKEEAERVAAAKQAEQERLAAEALARKPGVRIGMTAKQVREQTSWGIPESVNRTTTARSVTEQWVYGGGGYLYFTNGRLTAIQN